METNKTLPWPLWVDPLIAGGLVALLAVGLWYFA